MDVPFVLYRGLPTNAEHSYLVDPQVLVNQFECPRCSYTVTQQLVLKIHIISLCPLRNGVFNCAGCHDTYTNLDDYEVHVVQAHYYDNLPDMKYFSSQVWCCNYCSYRHIHQSIVVKHVATNHYKEYNKIMAAYLKRSRRSYNKRHGLMLE